MRVLDATLAISIVAATVGGWAVANRPVDAPPLASRVAGYAFSPARAGEDPSRGVGVDRAALAADVALVAREARGVRTYGLDGALAEVPVLALEAGLEVTPGVWLAGDAGDDARIERLATIPDARGAVRQIIVGNETLHRGTLDVDALVAALVRARTLVDTEISTAEPWHVWLSHPELAAHVDFITAHILPYWEGVHVDGAVGFVEARMRDLQAAFPGRRIVIGEVGWPTRGRTRGAARASRANAALFLRRFVAAAEAAGYEYFLMEAFDQPWKRRDEGDVGAYWGVRDVDRRPKLVLDAPVVPEPRWPIAAAIAAALALGAWRLLLLDAAALAWRGRSFLAVVAAALGSTVVWLALGETGRYWTLGSVLGAGVLALGVLGGALLVLVEAHEWAEARWARRRRGAWAHPAGAAPRLPRVSVHLAIHDEPPALVVDTLDALAALDYPDFEVVVVDNNTPDEATWGPVAAHCDRLGPAFRFVHVAPLDGYKAGALNVALGICDADAEVIAVVDSDYRVEPGWLRDLAGAFADPDLAVVQAPQDYRDGSADGFKAACHAEYRGFFALGMVTRNDRNAIIQHGTMTLVRRRALESAGGWAEWTVTEDAELGLRLLEHGWTTLYVTRSYGRGLTPDSFLDYKRQRARWALGAMQILRGHWREVLGVAPSALGAGQRYHFVAGWLPWLADGVNVAFAVAALVWSAVMLAAPGVIDAPALGFALVPLSLFGFRLAKVVHLYRTAVGASWRDTARAALAGLALAPSAGLAALTGLARRRAHFVRTPKLARRPGLTGSLVAVLPEAALGVALLACALALGGGDPLVDAGVDAWRAALLVLAAPFLAATCLAVASARTVRSGRGAALEHEAAGRA